MNITMIVIGVLVIALIGALARAYRVGKEVASAHAARDRAEAEADAARDRLRMQEEAVRIDRETSDLAPDVLDEELSRWSAAQR